MRQLTITVPDHQLRQIQRLLRQQPGVVVGRSKAVAAPQSAPAKPADKPAAKPKKKLTKAQQKWVDDLKEDLEEAEAALRGEVQLGTFEELMQELKAEHDKHWGSAK